MATKYFCDCCGEEIKLSQTSPVGHLDLIGLNQKAVRQYMTCVECTKKLEETAKAIQKVKNFMEIKPGVGINFPQK